MDIEFLRNLMLFMSIFKIKVRKLDIYITLPHVNFKGKEHILQSEINICSFFYGWPGSLKIYTIAN